MTKRRPMTEDEWLTEASPYLMLQHLHQHEKVSRLPGGQRRLRLFRCACCRSVWELFEDSRCCLAVEVTERFADGDASRAELAMARAGAEEAQRATGQRYHEVGRLQGPRGTLFRDALLCHSIAQAAYWTAVSQFNDRVAHIVAMAAQSARWAEVVEGPSSPEAVAARQREESVQANLLRDLFGNPFRQPSAIPPAVLAWNDRIVTRLAQTIYEDRAFDHLPVLADALLEAGCDNEELLEHCRSQGPHTRGCWAVDLLTGTIKHNHV
jgi:hypothetical protein